MGPTWALSVPDGSHVGPMNPSYQEDAPKSPISPFNYWGKDYWDKEADLWGEPLLPMSALTFSFFFTIIFLQVNCDQ